MSNVAAKILAAAAVSLAICQGQSAPIVGFEQIASKAIPFELEGKLLGVWSSGALLVVDEAETGSPVFLAFNESGNRVSHSRLNIPDAGRIGLSWGGFARANDGSIVACGSAYSHDSRAASFIAWIDAGGQQQRIIRLSDFVPHKIGVDPNGSVWAAGRDRAAHRIVMRRYDGQGRFLGLAGLAADGSADGQFHSLYHSYIVTSRDRVGWYSAGARQYVEFDLKGKIVLRLTTDAPGLNVRLSGAGLSMNGDLYVASRRISNSGAAGWEISLLNKSTGAWQKMSRTESWGYLYGCDGDSLVVSTSAGVLTWLVPHYASRALQPK
jgi:hypothetical protein